MTNPNIFLLAALILSHVGADVRSQQQQPSQVPGTFRSRISLVPVDVRVLDRSGRPVTDLAREDFSLLEDGIRQEISHFSAQMLSPEAPKTDDPPALRKAVGTDLAPQTHRIFLIVLGRGRLQPPAMGVDGAIRFVRERLLPQDQVAVLAYNRATDFTTDRDKVVRVLERFKSAHERIEAKLRSRLGGLAAIYGSKAIPPTIQTDIDEMFRAPGMPGVRVLPPGQITDSGIIEQDTRRRIDALNPLDASFDEYVAYSPQTMLDLGNIYTGIEYLRYLEGEKHLIFVTEQGLFLPRRENDEKLAATASDARVAIDTIHTGGMHGERPGLRSLSEQAWARTFMDMASKNVSELTGGHASLYKSADGALNRIDQSTRFHYLLGYYPSNSTWDGEYRRIDVKVKRPGLTALYRHGYFGRQQLVPFDRREFMTYSRISLAGNHQEEIHDIKLTITGSIVRDQGAPLEVHVAVAIDPSRIWFVEVGSRRVAAIDLAIFLGDARSNLVGEFWQKIDLNLTTDAYRGLMRDGMTYKAEITPNQLPAHARPHFAKAVVYDYNADLLGTAVAKLR